ncbi:hypothetical protein GCM10027443_17720 [Pontibacter brevis]
MRQILLVISLFLFSCSDQITEKAEKLNEQNLTEEANLSPPPPPLGEHIDRNDVLCLSEIERAKADVKKGILVYSKYGGIRRHDDELEELLKKFNVAYKPLGMNCEADLNCYGVYMDSLIAEKYGDSFIRSLGEIADHMFEARWATKTYEYWDVDVEPKYSSVPPDTFILKKLTFPKGWDYEPMRSERQFFFAEFVIDTTGMVSDIKVGNFGYNLKDTNEKYLAYFKREIKSIIEEMEPWEPALFNSHKVKSWYLVDINLDKDNLPQQNL